MAWTQYVPKVGRQRPSGKAELRFGGVARKTFGLNKAALEILENPERVHLFLGSSQKSIGITKATTADGLMVTHPKGGTRGVVSALGFAHWAGIDSWPTGLTLSLSSRRSRRLGTILVADLPV